MNWVFNKADGNTKQLIYESIKKGKSRFGWSLEDKHNLLLENNWTKHHSKQLFLLQVQPGDWIVHVNTPERNNCIAAKVKSSYKFDEGLKCDYGIDFRHNFEIDTNSIIEFDRKDPNVLPSVNLNPRQRYHRIYATEDFLQSIENLKNNTVNLEGETREEYYLKEKITPLLEKIIEHVQEMHKSKLLEKYIAKVFRKVPGVINVHENGSGWKTDHGADLIITMSSPLASRFPELENKIIVQIKSFVGEHYDVSAVDQIATGLEKFNGAAGIIVSTAKKTEKLENKIQEISDKLDKPIDLLAYTDLAQFIIKYYPESLFDLN